MTTLTTTTTTTPMPRTISTHVVPSVRPAALRSRRAGESTTGARDRRCGPREDSCAPPSVGGWPRHSEGWLKRWSRSSSASACPFRRRCGRMIGATRGVYARGGARRLRASGLTEGDPERGRGRQQQAARTTGAAARPAGQRRRGTDEEREARQPEGEALARRGRAAATAASVIGMVTLSSSTPATPAVGLAVLRARAAAVRRASAITATGRQPRRSRAGRRPLCR